MIRLPENQQIGIDIVKIERFRKKKIFENQSFYEKIFTKSEISYCKRFIDPYPHFAGKFALKEAVQKSINENLVFNKIETLDNSKEKYEFTTSISHENEYAIAIALSKKEN